MSGGARENCVDPDTRDLFVILERADTGTLIPATSPSFQPFEFIAKDVSSGGLGITVHEVSVSEGDIASSRQVTQASDQKAVRVDENNTRSDFSDDCTGSPINVPLGWTSNPGQGLPEDGLYSTVNTKNIVGYIDNYCEEISGQCKDASTPPVVGADNECDLGGGGVTLGELDSLDHLLIKYIIAHEVAHNLKLRWKHTNKNGWHHSAGSGTIMEKSVKVDDGTDVVFHISDNFDLECQKAARVWE